MLDLQEGPQGLQRGLQGLLTGPDLPENRDLVQGPETVIPGKAETAEITNVLDPAVEIANIKGQDHVTGRRGEEGLRGHLAVVVQVAGDPGRSRGHPGGHQLASLSAVIILVVIKKGPRGHLKAESALDRRNPEEMRLLHPTKKCLKNTRAPNEKATVVN